MTGATLPRFRKVAAVQQLPFPVIFPLQVQTFALGYRGGFWRNYDGRDPRSVTVASRAYAWSFAGSLDDGHGGRKEVLEMFKQVWGKGG